MRIMSAHGLKKVNGDLYSLSVRRSESVKASETEEELKALPEIYKNISTVTKPDKKVIREALKGGLEIPGCSLQESLSLQIR